MRQAEHVARKRYTNFLIEIESLVRKPEREITNRLEDSDIGERTILQFILIRGVGGVEWIFADSG
jgi:hypothetical protein